VAIIPGIDHSDFCPGFKVPGDVYPSDVDKTTAMKSIGDSVSAFLHLHTTQSKATVTAATKVIKDSMDWTSGNLLAPLKHAFTYAISEDGTSAPWCEIGQKKIAGLKNSEDLDRLHTISIYKNETKPFEDTRVNWATEGN